MYVSVLWLYSSAGVPYEAYQPIWFKQEKDPTTGNMMHVSAKKYWDYKEKQKWPENVPDIF